MSISSKIALAMSADGASFEEVHDNLVKIAEDFVIGFGEYIDSLTTEDMGTLSIKELLEIYKETL